MSHVVMQAAELPSVELAVKCEQELRSLVDEYIQFEKSDPDPWAANRVPPPLASFGRRHGVEWPKDDASRFFIKGLFEDEARVLHVDRMVFFWAGGFDLGGPTLREILRRLGALATARDGDCHLVIRHDDPSARIEELAEFLRDEDFQDQFTVGDQTTPLGIFSLTVMDSAKHRRRIAFDDSGVQDWGFTTILPQLSDEDPTLSR